MSDVVNWSNLVKRAFSNEPKKDEGGVLLT
jgi:hypothetical protein